MVAVKFIVCAAANEARAASENSLECILCYVIDQVLESR